MVTGFVISNQDSSIECFKEPLLESSCSFLMLASDNNILQYSCQILRKTNKNCKFTASLSILIPVSTPWS